MHLFQAIKSNKHFIINEIAETHHCVHVTRHKLNDEVLVTDFQGIIYKGKISSIEKDNIRIEIIAEHISKSNHSNIVIAISLAQVSDRWEWFLEKATEIGVDEVIPIICKRTENTKNKLERWQKIILSSSKQCLRPTLMKINEPIKFSNLWQTNLPDQRYICHCEENSLIHLGKHFIKGKDVLVLIGPEGDFTKDEIELATNNQCIEASLGKERLRMETAGVTAAVIFKTMLNLE